MQKFTGHLCKTKVNKCSVRNDSEQSRLPWNQGLRDHLSVCRCDSGKPQVLVAAEGTPPGIGVALRELFLINHRLGLRERRHKLADILKFGLHLSHHGFEGMGLDFKGLPGHLIQGRNLIVSAETDT